MPAQFGKRTKGNANYLKPGTNNVISDRDGFKYKANECRYEWNGLLVHESEWEERHPMDFLQGIPDNQSPQVSRPEGEDVFISGQVNPEDL